MTNLAGGRIGTRAALCAGLALALVGATPSEDGAPDVLAFRKCVAGDGNPSVVIKACTDALNSTRLGAGAGSAALVARGAGRCRCMARFCLPCSTTTISRSRPIPGTGRPISRAPLHVRRTAARQGDCGSNHDHRGGAHGRRLCGTRHRERLLGPARRSACGFHGSGPTWCRRIPAQPGHGADEPGSPRGGDRRLRRCRRQRSGRRRELLLPGRARFDLGDFAAAEADIAKAIALRPGRVFFALWLYLARASAGKDGRPDIARDGAAIDLDDWPGPIVLLYLGLIEPRDIQPGRNPIAWQELGHLCEAKFFLGHCYRLQRMTDKAAAEFRAAVDTGVVEFVEYHHANVALRGLRR